MRWLNGTQFFGQMYDETKKRGGEIRNGEMLKWRIYERKGNARVSFFNWNFVHKAGQEEPHKNKI